jgi:probable addiction module antidote protein
MPEKNITLIDLEGLGLEVFDPAQYISSDESVLAYINEALAANDAGLLASAIGDVARARGMTEIARSAGITREALYKALRQNSQPRMETIARVLAAMRLRLVVEPITEDVPGETGRAVPLVRKTAPRPTVKASVTPAKKVLNVPKKAVAAGTTRTRKHAGSEAVPDKAPVTKTTARKATAKRLQTRSRPAPVGQ